VNELLLPILFTLFVWWFSTGLILWVDGLPRSTHPVSFALASGLLTAGLAGLAVTAGDASVSGAYAAFGCGVMIWAWHETGFLLGFVTGPRNTASPSNCPPGRRLLFAIQTILYHELALALTMALVVYITWDAPNRVGMWTFVILWTMRQSAKLNLFLGVRNLSEEFLPDHLGYLSSYFTRRRMNLLFPLSVTVSTVLAVVLWRDALAPHTTPFERTGLSFAGTLLTLAILEHWFLVLPFPTQALWRWAMRSRAGAGS
jgi:putative photosynthetic complex assembly protein 2